MVSIYLFQDLYVTQLCLIDVYNAGQPAVNGSHQIYELDVYIGINATFDSYKVSHDWCVSSENFV